MEVHELTEFIKAFSKDFNIFYSDMYEDEELRKDIISDLNKFLAENFIEKIYFGIILPNTSTINAGFKYTFYSKENKGKYNIEKYPEIDPSSLEIGDKILLIKLSDKWIKYDRKNEFLQSRLKLNWNFTRPNKCNYSNKQNVFFSKTMSIDREEII